jgi:hypothetical protein
MTSGHNNPALTPRPLLIYCASLYQIYTSNEMYDFVYGGVIVVTWFHKELAHVTKS